MCKKYIARTQYLSLVSGMLILLLGIQSNLVWSEWRLENVRPITTKEEGWFMKPRWSPDGEKIMFTSYRWRGIYIKNADGTGKIGLISENISAIGATWSREGDKILILNENQIKKIKIDNKNITPFIVPNKKSAALSSLCPLSDGFFYIETEKSDIEAEKDIFTIVICDSNGKCEKRINSGIWGGGVVSPDGKKIVYCELNVRGKIVSPDSMHVWLADSNGINKKLIAQGASLFPALWSPDSKKILIGEGSSMFVFMIENSEKINLGTGENMTWSPDGEWILYENPEDDGHNLTASDIYIIRWDGSLKSQLTSKTIIEVNPVFSPDGNGIAFSTEDGIIFVGELIRDATPVPCIRE